MVLGNRFPEEWDKKVLHLNPLSCSGEFRKMSIKPIIRHEIEKEWLPLLKRLIPDWGMKIRLESRFRINKSHLSMGESRESSLFTNQQQ